MHAYTKCNRSRGCVFSFMSFPARRDRCASSFPRNVTAALVLAAVSGSRISCAGGPVRPSRNSRYRAPSSQYPPHPKSNFRLELNFGIAELPPDFFLLNVVIGDFTGGVRHE